MSTRRSFSAVHDLRAIFESKASEASQSICKRSPTTLHINEQDASPPELHVHPAPVDSAKAMDGRPGMAELKRESSAGLRRGSFSESNGIGELSDMRKTVSQEQERRQRLSIANTIPEVAVESAQGTPRMNGDSSQDIAFNASPQPRNQGSEAENPDKLATGAEKEPGRLRPAMPDVEDAVTGGAALPPAAEDLRPAGLEGSSEQHSIAQNTTSTPGSAKKSGRSPHMSKKTPPSAKDTPTRAVMASTKPPGSQLKSPLTGKTSASAGSKTDASPLSSQISEKKAGRSSLTAPTTASLARATSMSEKTSTSANQHYQSAAAKPKHRETTKPLELPSRLTAPTAASKAKHEPVAPSASAKPFDPRSSVSSRLKPQTASAKPTPRSSLTAGQQPESRTAHGPTRRTTPLEGSFLDRMTRPTTSSSSKAHEKVEHNSPPRSNKATGPVKQKTNGHAVKPNAAVKPGKVASGPQKAHHAVQAVFRSSQRPNGTSHLSKSPQSASKMVDNIPTSTAFTPENAAQHQGTGNETPVAFTNGVGYAGGTLETTPAFGGDEAIR